MALAANALVTIATVEEDLGISSGSEDSKLTRYINAASEAIAKYCHRLFHRDTARVEKVAGHGNPKLRLGSGPINSVTSIVYDGGTIDSDSYEIHNANAGLLYGINGWNWTAAAIDDVSNTPVPGTERKLYTVTYDGGYYTAPQVASGGDYEGETRNLPYDVEEACIELVRAIRSGKKRDPDVKSERLLSWSANYGTASASEASAMLPASVRRLLNQYRWSV